MLPPLFKRLICALWCTVIHVRIIDTGHARLLVLVLSKSCAVNMFGIQLVQPEWIRIGICKYLTE